MSIRRLPSLELLALLFTVLTEGAAVAQCPRWLAGQLAPYDGIAYASTVWDPDGAGPGTPRLVVGGWFTAVTSPNAITPNIAMYSGASWAPIGDGIGLGVTALAVFNGSLYAGIPSFLGAGGGVGRWTGSSWSFTGSTNLVGSVNGLTVFNGELIAVGNFEVNGGTGYNVAAWNGSSWRPLGVFAESSDNTIRCVHVHNGQLYIGGDFDVIGGATIRRIARWTGTTWIGLGLGINDPDSFAKVTSLASYQGELVAAGVFAVAGGVQVNNFARWDGITWRAISNSLRVYEPRFTVYGGELIVGDVQDESVTPPVRGIAKWNGTRWATLRETATDLSVGADVKSFTVFNGELIVGGTFSLAGGIDVESLARWNGTQWLDMSGVTQQSITTPGVNAMTTFDGKLILGGIFEGPKTSSYTGSTLENLAAWDGVDTSSIADERPDGSVIALFSRSLGPPTFASTLYVGGAFTKMNRWSSSAPTVNHIACLTRGSIFPTEPGWQPMGEGFNDSVWSIALHNGSIYAAGDFTASGATTALRVARWTGSNWLPVGAGFNGAVRKLISYSGSLYAGGFFTSSGLTSTGGFARFDGVNWQPVGGFFSGEIYALGIDPQNRLAIGGSFTGINASPNLAWYNGTSYGTYGMGGADGIVRSFVTAGSDLIVGGQFNSLGGITARRIGRWNGAAWSGIDGGIDGSVRELAFYRGEIQAGGGFTNVSTTNFESHLWTRYTGTGAPWIGQQPQNLTVCDGGTALIQLGVAIGYPILSSTWRKNGVPLNSGPTPWGSSLSVQQDYLYIFRAALQDGGDYDCVVTTACGDVTSFVARLTVCIADFNCDDALSVQDIFDFLAAYFSSNDRADVNSSGSVTVQDIFDFLAAYFAGC